MTTITRTAPKQDQAEARAIHHNMQRDDWMPRLTIRGEISRTIQNAVFPDGEKAVLMRHGARAWAINGYEDLGRFKTSEAAARAARAEALRQWAEVSE